MLDVCQEALAAGIEQARVEHRLSDISHAVQSVVEGAGFSVIRSLVGHGVGRSYHEDPQIPNYGPPGHGPLLQEGMTLAIEPMITAGGPDVYVHADDWSISSVDESLAAHFEHTVAICGGPAHPHATGASATMTLAHPPSAHGLAVRAVRLKEEKRLNYISSMRRAPCFALSTAARRARHHLREDAQELHPHPAGDKVKVELAATT